MKKTYIHPEMEIVEMLAQQPMLAGSGPNVVSGEAKDLEELLGREIDDLNW